MVGLGNPGDEYAGTRHNVGADVVALLAERHGGRLRTEKGLHALAAEVAIEGRRVLLAVPVTYMNDSGRAVGPLVRRAGIAPDDLGSKLVVVHDELDLPPGRVKLKSSGGNAGHNGLKSIEAHLHSPESIRVRIGIGKPPGRQPGAEYVLRRPGAADRDMLATAVAGAADAVELVLRDGVERAMNQVNAEV